MIRTTLLAALAVSLCACEQTSPQYTLVGYETRAVVITEVDPPKWFSVSVKDATNGEVYENAASSKRCYGYTPEKVFVGRQIVVPFKVYDMEGGGMARVIQRGTLEDLLCGE